MEKRGTLAVFSIIFLFILMPGVFSIYEESVYSGTVEDGDTVEIADRLFKFRIDSVSNKVYVEIDASAIIIPAGECRIKDNLDICIGDINFSYKDLEIYRSIYKTLVSVFQIKSQVDITHTIEKENILIDEETTAELAIENTADTVAEDLTAAIGIPPSILVTSVEGCKKNFDSIVLNEDVHPRQIKKCTYKIIGLSGGDFELKADVSYFDGINTINSTSPAISGKVYNQSLKITPKLNKSKFNIQEKLDLTIDIQNTNDQYDITITNFNIKIPRGLLIVKKPRDAISNNRIITWSGTLATNETKSFVVKLESRTTGNYSILIEASYKVGKFFRTAKSTSNIEVYCNCPYINHDFSQRIAVPEQRVRLKAFISNPSQIHTFRNVNVKYITNIPDIQDFSIAYAEIKPFESISIFDSPIITPDLGEIYYLNITAAYEARTNQIFVVKGNIIIKIPEEKKIGVEEQPEVEEQQEVEEVSLGTEEPIGEAEETGKNETDEEEVPVTIIEDEESSPLKAYIIITFIALIIFILVVIIIFKRKKSKKIEKDKDAKELEAIESKEPGGSEEEEFKYLEQQVRNLKGVIEADKQKEKKIFKRLFKKK